MRITLPLAPLLAAAVLAGCGSSSSSSGATASSASSSSASSSATSSSATTQSTTTSASSSAAGTAAAPPLGPLGPEGIPLEQGPVLAPASSTLPGTTVDGIHCAPVEQLAYHIHAHLQVFVNGQARQLPPAIGLVGPVAQQSPAGPFYGATKCYYWLHVHAADGILHIESPTPRIYTLGDFFDEWHQPLSASQVGPATGTVTAFLNGRPWTASPRAIPLAAHNEVQLDVGGPTVAFQKVPFGGSGL